MSRPYGITAKLLLLTITLSVSLALVEAAARLAGFKPRIQQAASGFEKNSWAAEDNVLGWVNREGVFKSPEAGHVDMAFWDGGRRVSRRIKEKRAKLRVDIVGCSNSQGFGITSEETFGYLLNEKYPDILFENYATGAYGTYQSLLRLGRETDEGRTPDIAIYGFLSIHDRRNVARPDWVETLTDSRGRWIMPPHVTIEKGRLVPHAASVIGRWPLESRLALSAALHRAYLYARYSKRWEMARPATKLLLSQMKALSVEKKFRLLVVSLRDVKEDVAGHYEVFVDKDMDAFMKNEGMENLDCRNPRNLDPEFRVGGAGHPNGKQHALWAGCISGWLDKHPQGRRDNSGY